MPLANSFLRQHAERYREEAGRVRRNGARSSDATSISRKRARTGSRDRTRRPHVTRATDESERSWPNDWRDDSARLEDMSLEDVEAFLIKKALARHDGNARKAAEALGLSRSAFYRRLQHYGL